MLESEDWPKAGKADVASLTRGSRRMVNERSITVNGDLGSGKSTVSVGLAERLKLRRISVGDLYRQMARERGMSALEINLHAELDDAIDATVDNMQREIAESGEQVVMDSRLAWHFFKNGFKVHLITEPTVAAQRFLVRYHADKRLLRNYDIVCDTTRARPEEVIELIVEGIEGKIGAGTPAPLPLLDPAPIYPTQEIRALRGIEETDYIQAVGAAGPEALEPLSIGYAQGYFFVVDGHRRLSAALRNGFPPLA